MTGAGIIKNTVCPTKGTSIAIFGLGGIGLSALMGLVLFECEMVIAVDVSEERLDLAKSLVQHIPLMQLIMIQFRQFVL